jgi:teichuronic acid biosynthesis glycosyltransferase TuaH
MRIVYFSPINWFDLKQRPQHIAEELSRDHEIIYIEPSLSFINCLINKNDLYKTRELKINNNLAVYRPSGKWRLPKSFENFDFSDVNVLHERGQLKKFINNCDLIWVGSPVYYSIVRNRNDKKIVFDKMDDYAGLTNNNLLKRLIVKYEKELNVRADIIFASSKSLYEMVVNVNKNVYIVNNGLDEKGLRLDISNYITEKIASLKKEGKIVFGYVGTIDHWFDYDAIKTIVDYDKNYYVVLVGKNNMPREKFLHEQVKYFNPVDKSEVYSVIKGFDYCLYPFKNDKLLDTINPVKIYEYLGCNKKVIAVVSMETKKFNNYLNLYSDSYSLCTMLKRLSCITSPFDEVMLHRFIEDNSWVNRSKFINDIISKIV